MTHAAALAAEAPFLAFQRISTREALRAAYLGRLPEGLDAEQRRRVYAEQFAIASRQADTLSAAALSSGVILVILHLGEQTQSMALTWFVLYAAATALARFVMRRLMRRTPIRTASDAALARLERAGIVMIFTVGAVWGCGATAIATDSSAPSAFLSGAILAGVACKCAMGLHAAPRIAMAYISGAVTCGALCAPIDSASDALLLGLAFSVGLIDIVVVVARSAALVRQSTILRLNEERDAEVIGLLLKDFEANASDWLWETNERGALCYVPERMRAILRPEDGGRGVPPLMGARLEQLAASDDGGGWEALSACLRSRRAFRDIEAPVETPHGKRWWSLSGAPRFGPDGAFLGFRGVGSDISERRRTEDAMRDARHDAEMALAAKSRFVASMSHELRTPLNAVVGYAELLARTDDNPALAGRSAEFAREIESAGRHLIEIVNDVLDIAVIDGPAALQTRPVSLAELSRCAIGMLRAEADAKGVALRLDAPADRLFEIDERRTRQALVNVLNNAIRHTQTGGSVRVSIESRDNGGAALCVRDTGEGMDPEVAERFFEPFAHGGGAAARTRDRRLGLGLSIVRAVARAHGGEACIRSGPQEGTCVCVALPASRALDGDSVLARRSDA